MLLFSFAIRLAFFPLPGYQLDLGTYQAWFQTAANQGIGAFYSNVWSDYPPFNVYIFWVFGSLANAFSLFETSSIVYVIKLVPNIFDLLTAVMIYVFVRKQSSFKMSILATALYAFNPAVVFNAAVWGQFDAIYTFFVVLSLLLALKSKPEYSAISLAIGLLTKPQGIALAPLIIFIILKKNGVKRLFLSLIAFVLTVFIVILPFEWSNPVTFLGNIYFGAYSGYAVTSANAFNLWALVGLWVPDGNLFSLGWALFGTLVAFVLYVLNSRFNVSGDVLALFSAFLLFFGFFMLPTRIHERYLFAAISTLALTYPFLANAKAKIIYAVVTATCLINQAYVLYWLNVSYPLAPNLTGDPMVLAVSTVNLLVFFYALLLMWGELKGRSWLTKKKGENHEF